MNGTAPKLSLFILCVKYRYQPLILPIVPLQNSTDIRYLTNVVVNNWAANATNQQSTPIPD